MDAFQRGLSRTIPAEKAASFFVGLKSWQLPSQEDDQLMADCIKQAAIQVSPSLRAQVALDRIDQFKQAADESTHGGGVMATPTPRDEGSLAEGSPEQAFLTNEQAGLAAEEQNSSAYFQQLLGSLREELAQTQEQAQQAQAQADQLAQQQQQHAQELASAQQEAQLAQSAALEQVQTANASASTAMQQAVDAENRALQARANEAASKIQQQQVRSQLFDMASQGLPGSEPAIGEEGNAAAGMQQEPPAAAEVPVQAGGESPNAGLNEAGQPASAEGMPGQSASTEQSAAAGPTALQPPDSSAGGAGDGTGVGPQSNSDGSGNSPLQNPTASRQGQVSIKVGNYNKAVAFLGARHSRPLAASRDKTAMFSPALLGGVAGGTLGLGLGAVEATGHGPDLDKLRAKIESQRSDLQKPGVRGFGKAFDLAWNRMLLTHGEAIQAHPVLGTAASGAAGVAMGMGLGRELPQAVREAIRLHRRPNGL